MQQRIVTLALWQQENRLLLAMKKRGFGQGLWNGFGGKLQPGETAAAAAEREMAEESGLANIQLQPAGQLNFFTPGGEDLHIICQLFRIAGAAGEPTETVEMRPAWFTLSIIPYDLMWPDDRYWLPQFLLGYNIEASFWFGKDNTVLRHEVTACGSSNTAILPAERLAIVVRAIPLGRVLTYGQVAALAGIASPRQVGSLLHANSQPENVACHRVVNAAGQLAQQFAFGGLSGQTQRLTAEGADVRGGRIDLTTVQWCPKVEHDAG